MEQYLHFQTRLQSYLIPLSCIHRITGWIPPKPVPFAPAYITGVIHFEGLIWIVIDPDLLHGHEVEDSPGELILFRHQESLLAFRVKRTRDIVQIPPERREKKSLSFLPEAVVAFMTVIGGELVYSLNLDEFIREFRVK